MSKMEHGANLSENEQHVLESLYTKETLVLGRELTLAEERKIRTEYVAAMQPKMLQGKRPVNVDDEFQWQPSVSMRKVRPR